MHQVSAGDAPPPPPARERVAYAAGDPLAVAVLAVGSHGDVAPFVDLLSNLPALRPTFFCCKDEVGYVRARGYDAEPLFGINEWRLATPELDTMTGLEFAQKWIEKQLSVEVLDQVRQAVGDAHAKTPFRALLLQTQNFGAAHFLRDVVEVPQFRIEVCAWAPNLASHPLLATTYVPECAMPLLWKQYWKVICKMLDDAGWKERCAHYDRDYEDAAALWQRLILDLPWLIGNDACYDLNQQRHGDELLVREALVTPRWTPLKEESVDAATAASVTAFLKQHNNDVGLVCFGSMHLPEDQAAKVATFIDACGPVILQKGTRRDPAGLIENFLWERCASKKNVLRVDGEAETPTPHAWLLPRVTWFVCHGGTGTTQAAVRARTPTMIVPCLADQETTLKDMIGKGLCPYVDKLESISVAGLTKGLAKLKATHAAKWAALPAEDRAVDYRAIQEWLIHHVAHDAPPRHDPYPSTWADKRPGVPPTNCCARLCS